MELLDARRYTGPNLVWDRPSAVLDIACTWGEAARLLPLWRERVRALLEAVDGWPDAELAGHRFAEGLSLAVSAPIDALYAAVELNEMAWQTAHATVTGETPESLDAQAAKIREAIADEANPELLRLATAAGEHDVVMLWDDDEVSLGLGCGVRVWPARELPEPDGVDWPSHRSVPIGLVTGTNGKTTSVRLAAHIARGAGRNVGMSSTDWVGVNDRVIDYGDYAGPGGARAALRDPEVDVAILETARGGLLRRGLGVARADAVLITNIAEDHLGDFGSRSIAELLDVKWIVTRALAADSRAILNADDPLLVAKASTLTAPITWFGLESSDPLLGEHAAAGGQVMTVRDGRIAHFDGADWHALCAVNDMPLSYGGTAPHNIANALGAAGLCLALGFDHAAISRGLTSMENAANPGRCNLFEIDDFEVLLDFAHNPQGMEAIFEMARRRPAQRRLLAFGQAGDRTDKSIRELARVAWTIGLDRVVIAELADYYRGREAGEVFGLLRDELVACGARPDQISHQADESGSLAEALDWAVPGDLVIMLALGSAKEILAALNKRAESKSG